MAHLKTHLDLSTFYRQEVMNKLPPLGVLSPELKALYPPGSNVSKVPETCGLLSKEQIKITNMDATELLERIATGELKSESVVLAFGLRASIAHQLTACLTDFFLEEALVRARELDSYFESTGTTIGLYHGLPISFKDMFHLEGKITSLGYLSIHQKQLPATSTSSLASLLIEGGAITYCHTNLPQSIMTLSCGSFWGECLNPFNTSLTSGGSSGGEAALLGMRGTPMGFGTDIGGSTRVPCGNVGSYGMRPTALRLPLKGLGSYTLGRDSILGTPGPMCHSLRDVESAMSFLLSSKNEVWSKEASLLEMSWRGDQGRLGDWNQGKRKLRVGIMRSDGVVKPLKPIERALEVVIEKLKESGLVELVEVEGWKSKEGWELIRKLYFPDGGKRVRQLLNDSETPEPLLPLTTWLLEEAGEELKEITDVHDIWKLNIERDTFRYEYTQYWNSKSIDVLLCPVTPGPASRLGKSLFWNFTSHFNLVDFPSISFPSLSKVEVNLDQEDLNFEPLSEDDRILHEDYKPEDYLNAPLSLQLVAKRFRDEELLDALKLIESIIRV